MKRRTRSADNYEAAVEKRKRQWQQKREQELRTPPNRDYIEIEWNIKDTVFLDKPEFELRDLLSEGTFSKIHLVTDKKMRDYVMKIVKKGSNLERWKMETSVMVELATQNHENLVNILHSGLLSSAPRGCTKHAVIMHRHGKSLLQVIIETRDRRGPDATFPVEAIRKIGAQILAGMQQLQDKNVLHLDVKPESIFFSDPNVKITWKTNPKFPSRSEIHVSNLHVRIGGFSDARSLTLGSIGPMDRVDHVQTQSYRAPEIFMCLPYSFKTDVWSVACILCELYTCRVLFYGNMNSDSHEMQFEYMQRILGQAPSLRMWREALELRSPFVERTENDRVRVKQKITSKPDKVMRLVANMHDDDTAAIPLFEVLRFSLIFDPVHRPSFSDFASHFFFRC